MPQLRVLESVQVWISSILRNVKTLRHFEPSDPWKVELLKRLNSCTSDSAKCVGSFVTISQIAGKSLRLFGVIGFCMHDRTIVCTRKRHYSKSDNVDATGRVGVSRWPVSVSSKSITKSLFRWPLLSEIVTNSDQRR